jgi:hypothetical protein
MTRMTAIEIVSALNASPLVSTVNAWQPKGGAVRHFVTLYAARDAGRGAVGTKIWLDEKSCTVTIERGKGNYTDAFGAAMREFEAELVAMGGVVTRLYQFAPDFTVKF